MQSVVDEIFKAPSRPRLAQNAPSVLPYAHYGLMGEVDAYQSVDWHMLFVCLSPAQIMRGRSKEKTNRA